MSKTILMRTRKLSISLSAILALCCCQMEKLTDPFNGDGVFTATVEECFDDTKTSIDVQGNVLWKKGNQVSIFKGSITNHQYQVTDASDGKTSAGLNPVSSAGSDGGDKIDNNVAFYPYSSTAEIAEEEGSYVISGIVLPSTQNYSAGSFGDGSFPMVAVTGFTSDMDLKFKNILGCLKLQLKGTASIASISVKGNNGEILCGAATVTASNGSIPSINLTEGTARTVDLDCGTGVQLNSTTATPFVIALPPVTMKGGFTVIVTDTEGKYMAIKTTKSQSITRSSILKMPEVNYAGKEINALTFTSAGSTKISLEKVGTPYDITIEYKLNNGAWTTYTIGTGISLNDKDRIAYRAGAGGNSQFSKKSNFANEHYYHFAVSGTGKVAASGNIMSLVDQTANSLKIPSTYYFYKLFFGCSSLTSAPELPATTLAEYCYFRMFSACSSLTSTPELPATTLKTCCYGDMFMNCTSLTTIPGLPATTLTNNCYWGMFYGCSSLTTAPELPATTLAESCYEDMFSNCKSLTTSPTLPATTLAESCYVNMFYGCKKLNYVYALFTTTPSDSYTKNWLSGVSSTGTFEKSDDATWDVRGVNGIPKDWKVVSCVDLGLSVKWATCNVGASKPQDYGYFYAFGSTGPRTWNGYSWTGGDFATIPSCDLDSNNDLKSEYDAAHKNWGGSWRMPAKSECQELIDNCTSTWTSNYNDTGVAGRIFTSKKAGYTDKSIFLPAAGYGATYHDIDRWYYEGSSGYYRSKKCDDHIDAWELYFSSKEVSVYTSYRDTGQTIRPVRE